MNQPASAPHWGSLWHSLPEESSLEGMGRGFREQGALHMTFSERNRQPELSEVSKRGWRTEGVGARKSFICQRFKPLSVPFLLCSLRRRGTLFGPFLGVCLSPTPYRQPLSKPLKLVLSKSSREGPLGSRSVKYCRARNSCLTTSKRALSCLYFSMVSIIRTGKWLWSICT